MASAGGIVRELRECFSSGRTRSYEWRISQLNQLLKMIYEKESEITDALHHDLTKPPFESFIAEGIMQKSDQRIEELDDPRKDSHRQRIINWIDSTGGLSAVFDFTTKGILQEAVKGEWWRLRDCQGKPSGVLGRWPSRAVTFIENHDTGSTQAHWPFPSNHIMEVVLSVDPVIGAIAAGNVVVLKPSEVAPAMSSLLARIIPQYLDTAAIRIVEGSVVETTALLEQKWDKIFYTGSGRVGRIVMAAAAKHLTPVTLELGGKCPVIFDPTADLEVAARRIVSGKWGSNNGQACIAPDYIITHESFAPKLVCPGISMEYKCSKEYFFGKDPFQSADLSRLVNFSHFTRLTRLLDDPKVSDNIVHGGHRDEKRLAAKYLHEKHII